MSILADIRSNLSDRLPTATEISAAETAQPMQGITNGPKTQPADQLLANWQRQGDTSTENGQTILREGDPRRLASLRQDFLVPEEHVRCVSSQQNAPVAPQERNTPYI